MWSRKYLTWYRSFNTESRSQVLSALRMILLFLFSADIIHTPKNLQRIKALLGIIARFESWEKREKFRQLLQKGPDPFWRSCLNFHNLPVQYPFVFCIFICWLAYDKLSVQPDQSAGKSGSLQPLQKQVKSHCPHLCFWYFHSRKGRRDEGGGKVVVKSYYSDVFRYSQAGVQHRSNASKEVTSGFWILRSRKLA